jgi:phosphoglycolate phosphatase-like HAD superfamily hydrolase
MVGDRNLDIECGRNAGVKTILVKTGYGLQHLDCGADYVTPTVTEAIQTALQSA